MNYNLYNMPEDDSEFFDAFGAYELNFGKNKGRNIEQIYEVDRSYLDWVARTSDFNPPIFRKLVMRYMGMATGTYRHPSTFSSRTPSSTPQQSQPARAPPASQNDKSSIPIMYQKPETQSSVPTQARKPEPAAGQAESKKLKELQERLLQKEKKDVLLQQTLETLIEKVSRLQISAKKNTTKEKEEQQTATVKKTVPNAKDRHEAGFKEQSPQQISRSREIEMLVHERDIFLSHIEHYTKLYNSTTQRLKKLGHTGKTS